MSPSRADARLPEGGNSPTILGLDTTTSVTTAGVTRGGLLLAERSEPLRRGVHARSLPTLVDGVIAEAGTTVTGLDAVAVAVGPGSFTGIRLGIGFAKGITFARGIPLVGIGTLDGLAEVAGHGEVPLAACLDARNGEVYLAFYGAAPAGTRRSRLEDVVALSPAIAAAQIEERLPAGGLVVGDAAGIYAAEFARFDLAGIRVVSFDSVHPRGGMIAALGGERLAAGAASVEGPVAAVYVRPSAAETSRGVPR